MRKLGPYFWLSVGGILVYFVQGNELIGLAFWLAPLFLLRFAHTQSPAWGFFGILAVLFVAISAASADMIPIPGVIYLAWAFGTSLAFSLPFLADRLLGTRLTGSASTLIFPLAWVTVEFAVTHLSPSGTWGIEGYTQFSYLPLVQVAAFTGLSGIAFLATWFASVVHWAWGQDFAWGKIRGCVLTCAAIVILVMLAGSLRLITSSSPPRTVRAAVVSYPRDMFKPGEATHIRIGMVSAEERGPFRDKMVHLQEWFLETTHREALAGAKIVIWPELNLLVFKEDEQPFLERARQLARTDSIYLLMGMATVTLGVQRPLENKALLINDSGAVICSYGKSHAMPGWETELGTPGTGSVPVVNTAYGRMAIAICFDADFPGFIRQAGEQHADLLLVPANDWEEIKHIHLAMAAFRAVEIGATMIRATSTGLSSLIDPYGRILAVTDHFAPGARVMVAQVPLASTSTMYDRVGDLFAWLCVAALVVLAGRAVYPRRAQVSDTAK